MAVENSFYSKEPLQIIKARGKRNYSAVACENEIFLGYYNEPRLIYTAQEFSFGPYKASNRRTVHLGVDIFAPAATPVFAPLDGEILAIENRENALDYGGMIILKHRTDCNDVL